MSAMSSPWRPYALAALALAACSIALAGQSGAAAGRRETVCTVTINSADEKASFMRQLPAARFRFVELVQPGRSDWLQAACRAGIRCDVLVISGHYDGANTFFSDAPAPPASLAVSDLERAACSGACSGLFAALREVYLFGCKTLDPNPALDPGGDRDADATTAPEPTACAATPAPAVWGESSRDRMRQIFRGVPVIYGFTAGAPLGPQAAAMLEQHWRSAGTAAVARGRPDTSLLMHLGGGSMTAVRGVDASELAAGWDLCRFVDARLDDAERARHIHRLLRGDLVHLRAHVGRIGRLAAELADRNPKPRALAAALHRIAEDAFSRIRFLGDARDAEPALHARLLQLARDLQWLTPAEHRTRLVQLLAGLGARRALGVDDVALACTLAREHGLHDVPGLRADAEDESAAHDALRACLGDAAARAPMLAALAGDELGALRLARAYLRQRPITEAAELHRTIDAVARMAPPEAQVLALETLARQEITEVEVIERLARLYARTPSWAVQAAIAGALVRIDAGLLAAVPLARTVRAHRLPAPGSDNRIDALLLRLPSP